MNMISYVETSTDNPIWIAAADRLSQAIKAEQPCDPVRDLIGSDDLDAAYAVQDIGTERALAAGRRIVGRKIGLTSKAVQRQLGVDQPDFGILFADMVMARGNSDPAGRADAAEGRGRGRAGARARPRLAQPTHRRRPAATEHVLPALEIVGSRIRNWDIRIADTIADNASSGLLRAGRDRRRRSRSRSSQRAS